MKKYIVNLLVEIKVECKNKSKIDELIEEYKPYINICGGGISGLFSLQTTGNNKIVSIEYKGVKENG